jgi:hypothetical protein
VNPAGGEGLVVGEQVGKDVAETVALPPVYPVRAVVTVAVTEVAAAAPVTVKRPVPLIVAEAGDGTVPAQLKLVLLPAVV